MRYVLVTLFRLTPVWLTPVRAVSAARTWELEAGNPTGGETSGTAVRACWPDGLRGSAGLGHWQAGSPGCGVPVVTAHDLPQAAPSAFPVLVPSRA